MDTAAAVNVSVRTRPFPPMRRCLSLWQFATDERSTAMGKIVVFENVSLDGVTQDPTGEEGFGAADWRAALSPEDRAAWARLIHDDVLDAQALLLGRRSYEYFAARYPRRTGATADRMNGMPKYVVSATLSDPEWNNTTVLRGDLTE